MIVPHEQRRRSTRLDHATYAAQIAEEAFVDAAPRSSTAAAGSTALVAGP